MEQYTTYAVEKAVELLAIDSPTGFTKVAADWVKKEFEALGFSATLTNKGGVLVDLGGADAENALLLEAHTDTLGGMVAEVKGASSRARSNSATRRFTSTARLPTPSAPSTPPRFCLTRT